MKNCGIKWLLCAASFDLRLCDCGQADRPTFELGKVFKYYIWPPVSVFLFLMLYLMLYGLILFPKGDFYSVLCI